MNDHEIRSRSVGAVVALISRTFAVQIISFFATLVLTYYLEPEIYGIFYLVSSVVNFLSYFSDVGLAAALIQKHEEVTKEDLSTTFTIQQILVFGAVILLFLLGPTIKDQYDIGSQGINLLYAMGVSFILSSLKTVPSIMLERKIQFAKLVLPQILENLVFNITAVVLAWLGYGITSFTYAVLARGVVGLFAVYYVYPWRPTFGIYRQSLKSLLKFGIPYQLNTFLAVLKDDGVTIILTKIIGTQGLGYIGWASKWSGLPLRIIMDNLTKVSFPTFSRLQNDKIRLAKAVETSLKYLCLATFPALILMAFLANPLAMAVPRYQKWLPAIVPLYFYLYNSAWASISTSLTNLLNAVGKIKSTFKLMIMWTGLTWAVMPALAIKFGYLGVAYATGIIATSSIFTIILAKKEVNFSITKILKTPILSSIVMSTLLFISQTITDSVGFTLIFAAIAFSSYVLSIVTIEGKIFVNDTINFFKTKHA